MGRASIRAAVAAYLTGSVATLVDVATTKPRNWIKGWTYDQTVPATARGYVHIEGVDERRAATGKKYLVYTVAVTLLMRAQQADTTVYINEWDTLLDAIKARLRVKPPLGVNDGSIFQCAEDLLTDESDLPQDEAVRSDVWGRIRFDVSEWLTA